jgi:putative ubiquitin-RnfH superfamily antitoxin RatB of RatAB toxin-antitoxin module
MPSSSVIQLSVEVVYARPDVQRCVTVGLPSGGTIRAAIERSRIVEEFPEIDFAMNKVGIFNVLRSLDHIVQAGDRIEIYRPLLIDPKEGRRNQAQAARAKT